MELDRTKIVIRQRNIFETLDLSLRVTAMYFRQLLIATVPIAIPLAILNHWALSWIVREECSSTTMARYLWDMALVVFLQAPVATLATTKLLGDTMFLHQVSWRELWKELLGSWAAILWTQGIWRGFGLLIVLLVTLQPTIDTAPSEGFIYVMAFVMFLVRGVRPFINEIVLLERNPVFAGKQKGRITVGRRNRSLHGPNTGELLVRGFLNSLATVTLVVLASLALLFVHSVVLNEWTWTRRMVTILIPSVMWIGVLFATVVRFLGYLDLRIRREGWEVELIVRAAAQELEATT